MVVSLLIFNLIFILHAAEEPLIGEGMAPLGKSYLWGDGRSLPAAGIYGLQNGC